MSQLFTSMMEYKALGMEYSSGFACLFKHCMPEAIECGKDMSCIKSLACILGCPKGELGCNLNCEVRQNADLSTFTKMTQCVFQNGCQPKQPDDMKCRVTEDDGQKNLTSVADIQGKWWVTKGVNPHYDSFPCQHNRYIHNDVENIWQNNVTWVDTYHWPKSTIGTVPTVHVTKPGYYVHEYPGLNQTEPWVVVSKPHDDYLMMLWCGENPVLKYAGGILLAKDKDYHNMPSWVADEFRTVLAKHDLDFDNDLFINDNSKCKEDEEQFPSLNWNENFMSLEELF